MEEIDIWRTARLLMTQHGNRAWLNAAERAEVLFDQKDYDGSSVWTRVCRAIEELERKKPREGEAVN